MSPKPHLPAATNLLFTLRELYAIGFSLILRGQISRTVNKIDFKEAGRTSDLAQVCLKQMARDLCHFKKEWGKWNLDITEVADRLRHVPDDQACRVFVMVRHGLNNVAKSVLKACATGEKVDLFGNSEPPKSGTT